MLRVTGQRRTGGVFSAEKDKASLDETFQFL